MAIRSPKWLVLAALVVAAPEAPGVFELWDDDELMYVGATGGAAAQQSAANGADWVAITLIVVTALAIAAAAWAFWHWRQKRQQEAPA